MNLSEKELLALKAVYFGCIKNMRLAECTFLEYFRDPVERQGIDFLEALEIIHDLIEKNGGRRMKRYIDADSLKAEFTGNFSGEYPAPLVKALIDIQPAADVAEVRHGNWIGESLECSECGKLVSSICDAGGYLSYGIEEDLKYCPFCGAKMDKEISNG